jgi:hypothetical protein
MLALLCAVIVAFNLKDLSLLANPELLSSPFHSSAYESRTPNDETQQVSDRKKPEVVPQDVIAE